MGRRIEERIGQGIDQERIGQVTGTRRLRIEHLHHHQHRVIGKKPSKVRLRSGQSKEVTNRKSSRAATNRRRLIG